jgi:hypothetical protein
MAAIVSGQSPVRSTAAFSLADDRRIIRWDSKKGERLTELKGHG